MNAQPSSKNTNSHPRIVIGADRLPVADVQKTTAASCGVRGNLFTLLHGLEQHQAPAGGRLRGEEFKAAVAKLREIVSQSAHTSAAAGRSPARMPVEVPVPKLVNVPLIRHEKEAARALADLHEELIVDVDQMSPEAAQYLRKRPWMTPELMMKWSVGWIPGNGRSLFRKNYFVYTHRNERGEVVSYSGRDLLFEKKWKKWNRDGKPEGKKPNKHRYVSGYYKGQELYGGFGSRLNESYVRESLNKYGVVVVEGMNDVMRLDELEVAAAGIISNKATDAQIEKLVRFAKQARNNRITLFPDCYEEGEAGFTDSLCKLAEHRVNVELGRSRKMQGGRFSRKSARRH